MNNALSNYTRSGYRDVAGWLSKLAVDVVVAIGQQQQADGVRGAACEIGVHRGKLFILLHLLTGPGEHSVAWDLFERQSENVDQSGHGDKEIFMQNLRTHGADLERISVLTANSHELTPQDVMSDCKAPVRLFSIDGGHTAFTTANDIGIAAKSICKGGAIILDDFFNESWPGVAEGAIRFFVNEKHDLVPVVIAGNKFIFTDDGEAARRYQAALEELPGYRSKYSEFLGKKVLVLVQPWRSIKERLGLSKLLRFGS